MGIFHVSGSRASRSRFLHCFFTATLFWALLRGNVMSVERFCVIPLAAHGNSRFRRQRTVTRRYSEKVFRISISFPIWKWMFYSIWTSLKIKCFRDRKAKFRTWKIQARRRYSTSYNVWFRVHYCARLKNFRCIFPTAQAKSQKQKDNLEIWL